MLRRRTLIQGLLATVATPALAQNSFLTPGGSSVPGIVTMCLSSNVAVPCATGGGGSFPPNVSGTQATIAADFAGQQYWASAASQASFAAWLTAIGGTYSRASSATYLQAGVVQTATANTPRFPTSLAAAAQGIRLTGAATNLLLQSNTFGTSPWTDGGPPLTKTQNQTGPDGVASSAVLLGATGGTAMFGLYQPFTYIAASYVFSVFAKKGAYNLLALDFGPSASNGGVFDLNLGAVIKNTGAAAVAIVALANGWYLCSITSTLAAGASFPEFYFTDATGARSLTLVGTETFSVFGAQLAQTAFPVDYIPTTTATVTQAADSFSFPYTQTTFSALAFTQGQQVSATGVISGNSATGAIPIYISSLNGFGTYQGSLLTATHISGDILGLHKTMVAGSPSGRSVTSDGVAPLSDAQALFLGSAPTSFYIGDFNGANATYGNIGQIAFWNGLVASTAEMQRLTT